jgi:hypothetical protein
MRNLLVGCILVILGIFLAMGYQWAKENFVPSPLPPARPTEGKVRYPEIDYLRENALRNFSEIPAFERQQLRDSLSAAITTLDSWLERVSRAPPELVCVGESHDDLTRSFLALRFFSKYPVDVLMLETTPDDLAILFKLIESGSPRLSILEADMAEVIRAARKRNAKVSIHGIEESRTQRTARFKGGGGSREESIFENFRAHFREGKRHAVLYGALHCLAESPWFFSRVRAIDHGLDIGHTLSVNVVNAHGSGETEAFVNFLENVGIPAPPFVIPHTSMLHAELYAWFPQLTQSFRQYDAVIVY